MALLERLHPRHWDGHRFLQFLTGLALLALAFAAPVAPVAAAPPPAVVVSSAEVQTASADDASPVSRDASPSEECRPDDSGYAAVARPVDRTAALAGVAQRVHGSRAPPRA